MVKFRAADQSLSSHSSEHGKVNGNWRLAWGMHVISNTHTHTHPYVHAHTHIELINSAQAESNI